MENVPPRFNRRPPSLISPTLVASDAPSCNCKLPAFLDSADSALLLVVPVPAAATKACEPDRLSEPLPEIDLIDPAPPNSSRASPERLAVPVQIVGAAAAILSTARFVAPPAILICPLFFSAFAVTVEARLPLPIWT